MVKKSCGDPSKDLLKKIIMGDKSDNIKPICKPMGIKTVEPLLALDPIDFEAWLNKQSPETIGRFNENRILVDWNYIPLEYTTICCRIDGVVSAIHKN